MVQSGRIAQELMEAERVSRRIHVRINSNGGEVYSGIFAHFYGLAAKGYHTGHAGGYAIHINADVGLAMAQGVEYREWQKGFTTRQN